MNCKKIKCDFLDNIFYEEKIDSTNKWAKRFYFENQNNPKSAVFIADMQTNGYGRFNRNWICSKGNQINMTILLFPKNNIDKLQQLCLCTALAVYRSVNELTGISCNIKWPNDILINNRKICGILCENFFLNANKPATIIGIGLNVNNEIFDSSISEKVTSIFIESNHKISRSTLINSILHNFFIYYNKFNLSKFNSIINEYKYACCSLNKFVKLYSNGSLVSGYAFDIDVNGNLLVRLNPKTIISVNHSEIISQSIYNS